MKLPWVGPSLVKNRCDDYNWAVNYRSPIGNLNVKKSFK